MMKDQEVVWVKARVYTNSIDDDAIILDKKNRPIYRLAVSLNEVQHKKVLEEIQHRKEERVQDH